MGHPRMYLSAVWPECNGSPPAHDFLLRNAATRHAATGRSAVLCGYDLAAPKRDVLFVHAGSSQHGKGDQQWSPLAAPRSTNKKHAASKIIRPAMNNKQGSRFSKVSTTWTVNNDGNSPSHNGWRVPHHKPSILPHTPRENASFSTMKNGIDFRVNPLDPLPVMCRWKAWMAPPVFS